MNTLFWLQKNLILSIPLTMIVALIYGYSSEVSYLKNLIIPLTFLMVLPMMITLPIRKVFEGGDMKVQLATQFINFAVTPFIAFAIGIAFFSDNRYLALGLLLTGLLPTSGMTISWTGMAKGNMAAAIKMTIFGLLIGSFLTPIYINQLMGASVEIEMIKIIQQITIIILIPLIIGHLIQRALIAYYGMAHYQEKLKKQFPPISTLGVLGIVFVAMALKAKTIFSDPLMLVNIFMPLLLLYLINFIISTLVGKFFFKRDDAIALLYGSVMRNLSIALAIAMTAFGKEGADIALVISLGYVIQVQMGAWVVKFTDQIYGKAGAPIAQQFIHEGVFSLHQSDTLQQAIQLLSEEQIHSLAVLDRDEKLIGILNLKEVLNLVADEKPMGTLLSDITLSQATLIDIQQPIATIAKEMQRTHHYKVLVTNKKGQIKGVISSIDIIEFLKV
ncbi:bile acid:sodium symporter [Psychromonas antarctica]|uniref:bile acid:sodium symporter n=1 Tax=Psychromonas antarctica TaxID=67573 RepID=UPI001EE94F64|nr:bile acid:sodium symporter [Psychromonas antarctica]MCG6200839.1 bile acid:sodium symporter [Psychromonas antarctica]